MRLIKTFGLAALAAVAAMAFVSASSAMAANTALCKVNQEPCEAANLVTTVHGVTTQEPILLTEGVTPDVKCLSSLAKASVLALGAPQIAHIEELIWTHCYDTVTSALCEVETKLLGLLEVLRTAANLATVTPSGVSVLVKCGTIIHCTYKLAAGATLHGLGASTETGNGHLTASGVAVEQDKNHTGTLCPKSTWDSLYETLEAIYISS